MRALTIGAFDPVHVDHMLLFKRCEKLADLVIVGVNSDKFYEDYRGKKPMYSQEERMAQVQSLGYCVQLNDGPGFELIESIRPEYLVVGSDWLKKDYLAQIGLTVDDLQRMDTTLVYVPRGTNISGSDIRSRL